MNILKSAIFSLNIFYLQMAESADIQLHLGRPGEKQPWKEEELNSESLITCNNQQS